MVFTDEQIEYLNERADKLANEVAEELRAVICRTEGEKYLLSLYRAMSEESKTMMVLYAEQQAKGTGK